MLICLIIGAVVVGLYGWWKSGRFVITTPVEEAVRHISAAYILVGAFLGFLAGAIVILIKYIMSGSLKSAKEMEEDFGAPLLGSFEGTSLFYRKRNTGLDRWLRQKKNKAKDRIFADEMAEMIAAKIKIEAKKGNLHQIGLIVDKQVYGGVDFADRIIEKTGQEPSVKVLSNILEKADMLEEMSEMDGVVLIGQIEQSAYDDLRSICRLCSQYQVNMIGSIAVE